MYSHIGTYIFYASSLVFAFIRETCTGARKDTVDSVMESITDAASAVSYVRGVQSALNVVMTLGITSHMWMPECQVPEGAEYDFIVVGAGTAGAIVASRLAQNKTKVLLIEAGGDPPLETIYPGLVVYTRSSPINYDFTVTNKRYNKPCGRDGNFLLNAGKMLGGSSSLNIMLYQRGTERDYEPWVTASKNPHWSLNNTLKYFKRTEKLEAPNILNSPYRKYHGVDGRVVVTQENSTEISIYKEAFREFAGKIVIDLNSNETLGFSRSQYYVSNQRESSATGFLKASDKSSYIHLLKHTEVTKILFDSKKNAVGVQAMRGNKIVTFKAKKEVILCAGVINTPKLLMLSGIGPKKHLESVGIKVKADLPVGENYHDHVSVGIIYKLGKASTPKEPTPAVDLRKFPFPCIAGYVALNESCRYPDYVVSSYFLLSNNAAKQTLIDAFYHRYSNCVLNKIYEKAKSYKLVNSYIKNAIPKSRGCVTLRSSNHKDTPIIDGGYFSNEEDLEAHVDFLQDYIKIGDTKVFKELGAKFLDPFDKNCGGHKFGTREYWKCYALCMMNPSDHGVGTCAMGSVVDGELNVFGVKRLRVVDASVIPVITTAGTAAPTMMIAEKGSNIIIQDMYKRKS